MFTAALRMSAFLFITSSGALCFSQQVIKPEDQQTTASGTIKLMHGFGPPGYGEDPKHDARLTYWALRVPVPINLVCTPEKPEFAQTDCQSAKRLKLFFPGVGLVKLPQSPAAKWKGREVIVNGKLHRADTAGEMTPIFIDVTSISSASPLKSRDK